MLVKRFVFVRTLLFPLMLSLACVTAALAQTQKFPRKPITLVVPYGPGSGNDVVARILQRKVTENSGYTMIVVNRPGATGSIALETTAAAQPDGHTIIIGSSSQIANQHLSRVNLDRDGRDLDAANARG
jgi:tripartite-type tricarboxylate transporter receptor subunit TctC